jgi:hypothetical protein
MSRRDGFRRSLVFAAATAAFLPVVVTFASPLMGGPAAVRLYAIAAAIAYTAGLAANHRTRMAALALTGLAGIGVALGTRGLPGAAVGAAAIVACGRGALLGGSRPLRAAMVEAALGLAGLGVARSLAAGGLLSICLAFWGYFLVQSSYFLLAGRAARDTAIRDPFERARLRLERLLQDERGLSR